MKKTLITSLTALSYLFSCTQPEASSETNPFEGTYSLYAMDQYDEETNSWNEWRGGMQGYIMYGNDDHVAVHLTTKGYEDTDLRFPNFTDTIAIEALRHLTNSYVYFARYTVNENEGWVQHERVSHSNPGDWGVIVKRKYRFSGDTLILQPMEQANSSLRLKWLRM